MALCMAFVGGIGGEFWSVSCLPAQGFHNGPVSLIVSSKRQKRCLWYRHDVIDLRAWIAWWQVLTTRTHVKAVQLFAMDAILCYWRVIVWKCCSSILIVALHVLQWIVGPCCKRVHGIELAHCGEPRPRANICLGINRQFNVTFIEQRRWIVQFPDQILVRILAFLLMLSRSCSGSMEGSCSL